MPARTPTWRVELSYVLNTIDFLSIIYSRVISINVADYLLYRGEALNCGQPFGPDIHNRHYVSAELIYKHFLALTFVVDDCGCYRRSTDFIERYTK